MVTIANPIYDSVFKYEAIFQNKEVRKMMKEEDDLWREYRLMKENERLRMQAAEERGRAEERAKAQEEKLEMARRMKTMNMPIEQIVAITGLSADEVAEI